MFSFTWLGSFFYIWTILWLNLLIRKFGLGDPSTSLLFLYLFCRSGFFSMLCFCLKNHQTRIDNAILDLILLKIISNILSYSSSSYCCFVNGYPHVQERGLSSKLNAMPIDNWCVHILLMCAYIVSCKRSHWLACVILRASLFLCKYHTKRMGVACALSMNSILVPRTFYY